MGGKNNGLGIQQKLGNSYLNNCCNNYLGFFTDSISTIVWNDYFINPFGRGRKFSYSLLVVEEIYLIKDGSNN
jgi:hypothetical protein